MSSRQFVATNLENLLGMPLTSKADLQRWVAESEAFQRQMKGLDLELPEEVWHFLADADIRIRPREASYRREQEAAVRMYVAELQKGAHAS